MTKERHKLFIKVPDRNIIKGITGKEF